MLRLWWFARISCPYLLDALSGSMLLRNPEILIAPVREHPWRGILAVVRGLAVYWVEGLTIWRVGTVLPFATASAGKASA